MICKRSRPVLVLHEHKTRVTLMTRLAGKTAAETIAAMTATFRRPDPRMRGSVTFDRRNLFRAPHAAARDAERDDVISATPTQAGKLGRASRAANGRIRRWLPAAPISDEISEAFIQE